uniref:Acetyltransferase n=1 Tax=Spodoptera exigua TaxID=7107 RepID=A0A1V0M899_SPOEX|nr:acetyltransferase [Spodoptera exigua]
MKQSGIILLTVLVVQAYSAPQFITFSEGKLGVNFGGYHAGVGLGGLAGGKGNTAGGLYAEAGTPFGPAAKAGLGGAVDGSSGTAGGLYAGATAGGNVNAAAGLGGAVAGGKAIGGGYSTAQSGGHTATSVLGGESGASGSAGFSVSAHKSVEVPVTVVKETEISVIPVEEVKTVHKKVYGEAKYEASNEITPVAKAGVEATANVNVNAQPEFVKEVSNWNRPIYSAPIIPPVFFQSIFSSLFGSPQRSYPPPMWLPPLSYNFKQVCRVIIIKWYVHPEA